MQVSGYRELANDSPVLGRGDFGVDAVLYSAPINYNWRVFGGGYGTGDFEEGTGHYRWMWPGAQWRGRDLIVEGESSHDYGYDTKLGLCLSIAYGLSDHWQIGGSGERMSGRGCLYARPHFKADGEFLIVTQHNAGGSDVSYFNPRSDLMLLPGLRLTHTLYRRHETAWEQIGRIPPAGLRHWWSDCIAWRSRSFVVR